jgi:hypothetical protein
VPSPQVLLFSLPYPYTINFTIPIFKTFNSKPNFPSIQSTCSFPIIATPGTPASRYCDLLPAHRHRRHLSLRQTPALAGHLPNGSTAQPIHITIPILLFLCAFQLGDAELCTGPPVWPYSSFHLPQRHCLSFVPLRPTGHHHRRAQYVQR